MYIYIYINFFICCLAALRPTSGQCLGDSHTSPILITMIFIILVMTQRSPGTLQRGWVSKPDQLPKGFDKECF